MPNDLPRVTRLLLIFNVGAYLLQMLLGDTLIVWFALWPWDGEMLGVLGDGTPARLTFHFWQLLSYGFLHGGLPHLGLNMLSLYMFGGEVEGALGGGKFLAYYLVCILAAAMAQLTVIALFTGGFYPTLGASGGIFGVMFAFAYLWPHEKISGFPFFIPLPAWQVAALMGGAELIYGVTGTRQGVAHFAHLGGMLGGYVMIRYWRGKLSRLR